MNKLRQIIPVIFAMVCAVSVASGQQAQQDTVRRVKILDANEVEYFELDTATFHYLNGNVVLQQDTTLLYCDSAVIRDETFVKAYGNVLIRQGDSLQVFTDTLIYDGRKQTGQLKGSVALEHLDQRLFTDSMDYDFKTKIATYRNWAVLTDSLTRLQSKRGYYFVDENVVRFRDSVYIDDPDFTLRADTLAFNTESKVAFFLGPTLIRQNESRLYCEDGFYDTENNLALFKENAQFEKNDQRASADSIRYTGDKDLYELKGNAWFKDGGRSGEADYMRYDDVTDIFELKGKAIYRDSTQQISSDFIRYDQVNKKYFASGKAFVSDPPQLLYAEMIEYDDSLGYGRAVGEVIWRDTSQDLSIICDSARYGNERSFFLAMGERPLMISVMDGDSLFLTADTLRSQTRSETDSTRLFLAYPDVRIYKSDLQAICDSLSYIQSDSMFTFYQDPVIWSDTSQFSGDTIHVQMANDKIDRILMNQDAFMVNSEDEILFNQVKGKHVVVFFREGEAERMRVEGNAQSLYFSANEEGEYLGVNDIACSEMMLYFKDNSVQEIRFYQNPSGEFVPMNKGNPEQRRLEGFFWEVKRRPRSRSDLFNQIESAGK